MAVACLPLSNKVSSRDLVDANAHVIRLAGWLKHCNLSLSLSDLMMQMSKVHETICTDAAKTVAAWFLLTEAGPVQRLGALLCYLHKTFIVNQHQQRSNISLHDVHAPHAHYQSVGCTPAALQKPVCRSAQIGHQQPGDSPPARLAALP